MSRRESLGNVAFWVTQRRGHRHSGLGEAQPQNCGKGKRLGKENVSRGDPGPRSRVWSGLSVTLPNSQKLQ